METILLFTWVIALPLVAAPIIYLAGRLTIRRWPGKNPAAWVTLAFLVGEGVLVVLAGADMLKGSYVHWDPGQVTLAMDGITLILSAVAVGLGALVVLFSVKYMQGEEGEEKFYALLLMMIGAMIGLVSTTDLFNLWVWFEAMAISSYMLVAFYRQIPASLEAGVKYLVQSAVGSVLVLLGIALVFAQTGTVSLYMVRYKVLTVHGADPLLLVAGALFIIGFGVKAAMVPMHTWLPDAHSQAPSGISAMLSGVVIEVGLIALIRALCALTGASANWGWILTGFGVINMLLGNLMALRQTQVKRLLAYSSLSHVGYILLGVGLAISFQSADAAAGAMFHIITHAMMKGLAFLAAGALIYALYLANNQHGELKLSDLNGASRRYPWVALTFSIAVLGLGGLPPLAGFMSKWQIFVGGFNTQNLAAMLLVVFAALNSVLSLGYYAPLVNRMYRHEPDAAVLKGQPLPLLMVVPLAILALGVVVLGFWPGLLQTILVPAAQMIVNVFGAQ